MLELSPSLRLEQYFAPASWPADNAGDLDLSTEPALLGDGGVVAAGKSRIAYLLDGPRLGGIGGQQASLSSICRADVDGGVAWVGTSVFLPCLSGIIAVRADESPASLHRLWSSGTGGGPPIVAGGRVWTISQAGTLYGLDPATGATRQQASIGVPANHFPTPGVGDGLLLAATTNEVVAFAASSTGAPTTTRPSTPVTTFPSRPNPTPPTVPSADPGVSAAGTAAIVVGGLAVIGATAWLGWWLRRRRTGRADSPADR